MTEIGEAEKYIPGAVKAKLLAALGEREKAFSGNAFITEVRLRRDGVSSVTLSNGKNIPLGFSLDRAETAAVVSRITENSLHAHTSTLRAGYVTLPGGSRVGVSGRAVTERSGGAVTLSNIGEISSVCFRISHTVENASAGIFGRLYRRRFEGGVLFYGPPGSGKTTLLRDIAKKASTGENPMRVVIVDTRSEIGICSGDGIIDRLEGYPKGLGIEIATRCLSPELIICDEIGGAEEAEAILYSQNTGVPLVATAHASSLDALLLRPHIKKLAANSVFAYYIGMRRDDGETGGLSFTVFDNSGARQDRRTQ